MEIYIVCQESERISIPKTTFDSLLYCRFHVGRIFQEVIVEREKIHFLPPHAVAETLAKEPSGGQCFILTNRLKKCVYSGKPFRTNTQFMGSNFLYLHQQILSSYEKKNYTLQSEIKISGKIIKKKYVFG